MVGSPSEVNERVDSLRIQQENRITAKDTMDRGQTMCISDEAVKVKKNR